MNAFLVLAVTIGVVSADVSSLGYQYNSPQTSYGFPSQISASSSNYNTRYTSAGSGGNSGNFGYKGVSGGIVSYPAGSVGTVFQGGNYQSGGSGLGYQGSSVGSGYRGASVGSGYQGASSGSGYQGASSGSGFQGGNSGSGYQGVSYQGSSYQGAGSGNGFQGIGLGLGSGSVGGGNSYSQQSYQQQVQFQQQPAQVFKHFYVHAAPEEPETAKPRGPVVLPPAQKHYKIIFIKTPAPAAGGAAIAPVVPQNEEKTIVYVLVKKPEELQDIAVPKIEQKPPTKPEVYFIKYKNKEDSQAVINNIVSDYNKGQQSVSFSGVGPEAGGLSIGGSSGSGSSGFSSSGSGFSSGGAGFQSGGAGFQSGGAGFQSGGAGFQSGGAGFQPGGAGFQSSGSGFQSGVSGLSAGGSDAGYSSGSSGLGFSSGGSGFSGSSGSGGSGVTVLSDAGFGGGYDSGAAGSSGSFAVQSSSESYNQGGASLGGVSISKSEPISQAVTTGYDSSDLASGVVGLSHGVVGASSTANYDVTSLSSSQGVPHETYGIPAFKTQ